MHSESNTVETFIRDLPCGAQPFADGVADARHQKPGF
jgi:hypothetical protein